MIDLYSDTKTLPTIAMRQAMLDANVGDEQADEDPTTLALCDRMAKLLGMEKGVFMPSGTMCNLVAILVHCRPGDEIICDHNAHIANTEAGGAAAVGGIGTRTIPSPHGIFSAAQLEAAIRAPTRTAPRSAMVSIEQSTNFSGGAVWTLPEMHAVRETARARGLHCHIDGARLLNASVATGIPPSTYCSGWDSAWVDLSKGLGCPVGAVMCGSSAFIHEAWQWKYRLGGAMRQSGVLAAAGLHALEHHVARLADDHVNALAIWENLAESSALEFDPEKPATNILRFKFKNSSIRATDYVEACLAAGVRVRAVDSQYIRAMTHLDVSKDAATAAAATLRSVAEKLAADWTNP